MNYCHSCGQENHVKRASMKLLVADFFSSYFTVDSKLFRTLKYLLIRPSFLSTAYLNGEIESYLRPIRLYVFISFAFFLLLGITASNDPSDALKVSQARENMNLEQLQEETNEAYDKTTSDFNYTVRNKQENEWIKEINDKVIKIFSNQREFTLFLSYIRSKLPILLFIIIPIFALFLFIFFYQKDYYYIDHFVFAMHLQAYFFVLLIIRELVAFVINIDFLAIVFLSFLIYGYIAALRFYKRKKGSTFFRLGLVGFSHTLLSTVIMIMFFLLVIRYYSL
jgi:hypothetical protein